MQLNLKGFDSKYKPGLCKIMTYKGTLDIKVTVYLLHEWIMNLWLISRHLIEMNHSEKLANHKTFKILITITLFVSLFEC